MLLKPAFRTAATCLMFCLISAVLFLSACDSSKGAEIILTTRTNTFNGNIYVGGEVNNPGIYPFSRNDTLDSLVRAAGGLQSGADMNQVSLTIPDPALLPQRIDINRAEAWLLEALPGIGAASARNIIEYREQNGPFRSLTDLLKVKGIGQGILDSIEDFITVSG